MEYKDIITKYGDDVKKAWDSSRNTHTILYKNVILPYDVAYRMYIYEDKSIFSIAAYIKETYSIEVTEKSLGKLINSVYGIHKPNPRESSAIHNKENSLVKTGYEHYRKNPNWKSKYISENIKKYGVSSYLQTTEGKEKTKKTLLKKFETTSPLKNKHILNKAQRTRRRTVQNIQPFLDTEFVSNVEEAIDIISNVVALRYVFKDKVTYSDIEKTLGIPYSTIQNYRKYIREAEILKENTFSTSYEEKDLLNFITSLYKGKVETNSKILDGKEIDIYLPDLSLGVEFNGNYWHSDIHVDANYHDNKSNIADSMGINLVNVWEDEWRDPVKKEITKSMLMYKLGLSNKVYARKTTIKSITNTQAKNFYSENHIQGGNNVHGISYGLFKDSVLMSAMTFSKSRYDSKYEFELLRFANKIGYTVIGGASKLLKHFEVTVRPHSIMSYSNRNFSKTGDKSLYYLLGFHFIKHTKPMYMWVNSYTCDKLSRYQTQVSKLRKYPDFRSVNPKETEYEYMRKKGYVKVSMVGNDLYVKEYDERE